MDTLNCKGRLLLIEKPIVMGIINSTPDSFYSNSRQTTINSALKKAELMISEGATILDIGGQSTRPESFLISAQEEMKRITPIIEAIVTHFPKVYVSIDTFRASVALSAIESGASIINDISGGNYEAEILQVAATNKVPYICMHQSGTISNIHRQNQSDNIIQEVFNYFKQKIKECTEIGIKDLVLDVGFGFGKTIEQNFKLVKELNIFESLGKPILLGVSRKSTIYKTLNTTSEEALNGTTVLNTVGLQNGASILRVHDVKQAVESVELMKRIMM